jgi:hypothetical protein
VACSIAGPAHAVAPSALLAAGVEARPLGNDVALGFATNEHDAVGVRIDPKAFSATSAALAGGMARAHSADPIRRVTPVPRGTATNGPPALVLDVDRADDPMQGRRAVPLEPVIELGAADGALSWTASRGGAAEGKLWPLDGPGDVEALRAASIGAGADATTAIAFRRNGAVWLGTFLGPSPPAAKGELGRVPGLGSALGSPAIAVSDGVVLASWADRASDKDPWGLRWVRFAPGEAPGEAHAFTPPPGGRGEQAMSPGIAALPGGRFLLVWTEGSPQRHDVRALTLGSDGAAIGEPLEISAEGVNAGQGQAAVNAAGAGVVAFLQAVGSGFEVAARPIACAL